MIFYLELGHILLQFPMNFIYVSAIGFLPFQKYVSEYFPCAFDQVESQNPVHHSRVSFEGAFFTRLVIPVSISAINKRGRWLRHGPQTKD